MEQTLQELMLVAYREDRDVLKIVPNVSELVEVRGDTEDVIATASHVKEKYLTPFDAIHLVKPGGGEKGSSPATQTTIRGLNGSSWKNSRKGLKSITIV